MGQNIAPHYFNTEKVAESALAHRAFDQPRLDFPELGGYFAVLGTLNLFLMALVCSEMDAGKLFERSVSSFRAEIQPYSL